MSNSLRYSKAYQIRFFNHKTRENCLLTLEASQNIDSHTATNNMNSFAQAKGKMQKIPLVGQSLIHNTIF